MARGDSCDRPVAAARKAKLRALEVVTKSKHRKCVVGEGKHESDAGIFLKIAAISATTGKN